MSPAVSPPVLPPRALPDSSALCRKEPPSTKVLAKDAGWSLSALAWGRGLHTREHTLALSRDLVLTRSSTLHGNTASL